jgi:hypothetical protein
MRGQHANSKAAHDKLDKATRHAQIIGLLKKRGIPLTDRQIMRGLGFTDMNEVRPRITELVQRDYLYSTGSTICRETRRPVRMCKAYARRKVRRANNG